MTTLCSAQVPYDGRITVVIRLDNSHQIHQSTNPCHSYGKASWLHITAAPVGMMTSFTDQACVRS